MVFNQPFQLFTEQQNDDKLWQTCDQTENLSFFQITFKTKIYHPNIDEKGQVCLPIISPENWKPATKTDQG